ncbi:YybH family protein [Pedobacter insulae]|uniref:DUF4440 domain-containing protein n=1 Tax=Pedobacter insulae TaxID=414048 RepID=A0A1I2XYH3_9SPHI|nr:DUF4440 domain-containing protein [Pedobacter insulae]SFH18455.1 conserved hypothetical protein [Pedobacter insulae]
MKLIILAVPLLTWTACTQKTVVDKNTEAEKIMQISREWSKAVATKDVDKIVSYWADDAIMYSTGEEPLKGKAAIRAMVQKSFTDPDFEISWEPKSAEVSKSGDLGYLLEESKMTYKDATGKKTTLLFNGVTIWRKGADGNWKNIVDMMSPAANK